MRDFKIGKESPKSSEAQAGEIVWKLLSNFSMILSQQTAIPNRQSGSKMVILVSFWQSNFSNMEERSQFVFNC